MKVDPSLSGLKQASATSSHKCSTAVHSFDSASSDEFTPHLTDPGVKCRGPFYRGNTIAVRHSHHSTPNDPATDSTPRRRPFGGGLEVSPDRNARGKRQHVRQQCGRRRRI